MAGTARITTGVDKLVELVAAKKRISIDDAAKKLSVPKVLIEEWADFLEEREVIGIEYKFATPYLVYKEMSQQDTQTRVKKFSQRKEGFERRVEIATQTIDKEAAGLSELKTEFNRLSKELEKKVGHAKEELRLLSRYDEMKKAVDSQILAQEKLFEEKRAAMEKQVELNKRAISRYLAQVAEKQTELDHEQEVAAMLKKSEEALERRLQTILAQAKQFETKFEHDQLLVDGTIKKIQQLKQLSEQAKKDITTQKKNMDPLLQESKKYETELKRLKKQFLDKISATDIKQSALNAKEITQLRAEFEQFFNKKTNAEKIIGELTAELTDMKKDLKDLTEEAALVKLSTKTKKVEDYVKDFEKKFDKLEAKRNKFKTDMGKLASIFKK